MAMRTDVGGHTVSLKPTVRRPARYRHPVNRAAFEAAPFGARVADRVTGFIGSLRFLVLQAVVAAFWLAAPLILLAGNRASSDGFPT
jgi:uncharacterized membrane protein